MATSLVAYVFHTPACYGAIGAPLRGWPSVLQSVPFVLGLIALSYAAVVAVEHVRSAWRRALTESRRRYAPRARLR